MKRDQEEIWPGHFTTKNNITRDIFIAFREWNFLVTRYLSAVPDAKADALVGP